MRTIFAEDICGRCFLALTGLARPTFCASVRAFVVIRGMHAVSKMDFPTSQVLESRRAMEFVSAILSGICSALRHSLALQLFRAIRAI